MDLGGERGDLGAREDGRAHDQVVGEGGVKAAGLGGHLPHRLDVGRDVAIQLRGAQLGKCLDLEARVGVLHIDREQAADLGVVDLDALQLDLPVLAEEVDLVAETGQRLGEVGVVDVAAGPAQHVAVEDEDPHRFRGSY